MADFSKYLRTNAGDLTLQEVLRASPGILLGVSPDAVTTLKTLDVSSIFDLASSRIFASASLLSQAGDDPRSVVARLGVAPADLFDSIPAGLTIEALQMQPISILDGIGAAGAATAAKALNVVTVRDLALWPPYLIAKDLLQHAFFPEAVPGSDLDAPSDLLPKSGEYPTERILYSTLVFDGYERPPGNLNPLETAGPVDLTPITSATFGFTNPGVGALLTFAQSWYAQGVALGQLLHSVSLAPAESTRIAMLDWSRRVVGKQSEDVTETESLANVTEHARALKEVTRGVASEAQSGFSSSNLTSSSSQEGDATGVGIGPFTFGGSSGSSNVNSSAMSFSSSSGRRELGAEMTQNVVDRTQQFANAARNRRATVVREVSQSEHETVSTRVLTNYNHMHALSVQYYEIVQIYRVAVQVVRVEKCLFVPLKLVDFTKPELVRIFHRALLGAAIDETGSSLLSTNFETVDFKTLGAGILSIRNAGPVPNQTKAGGTTIELPNDARLVSFYLMPSVDMAVSIAVKLRDGTSLPVQRVNGQDANIQDRPLIHEIESVTFTNPTAVEISFLVAFNFQHAGWPFGIDVQIKLSAGAAAQVVTTFTGGGVRSRLIDHLLANRLHYSQAVFRSLDPATVTLLLATFSYHGKPLPSVIDPQPVTTAGNYVVFRMHVYPKADANDPEEKAWAHWLDDHGISFANISEDLVPLPSGGVFAEAVLGRYNSAEKLDITRFWNWQDSPIPIQAPEIAPIHTGSRATEEDLKAGGFSQPLINIVNPTSLPDPTGMNATLQAIANGNLFRDMSGLAATIGLAQAGAQTAADAAGGALTQAGSNLATAAKKEVEMFKAALAFAGSVLGKGSPDTSPSTISNEGAKINHGRSLDTRGVSPAQSNSAMSPIDASGSSGGGGASGAPNPGGGGTGSGGSNEEAAFRRALWGSQGESQADAGRAMMAFALDAGTASAAALDPGNFAEFVAANRLDLEVADLLRALDGYPGDSWAKQIAAFAHHELKQGNLFGIFSSANVPKAKAVTPASAHAQIDAGIAELGNAFTVDSIGGPGAYKGVIVMAQNKVQAGIGPGSGRQAFAQLLAHELTHFRNRDFFVPLYGSSVADHPTFYVDTAKANARPNTARILHYVMGEIICNHVAWRVRQDLLHRSTGQTIPANPNKKGFYRYALALDGLGWRDNGYLQDLKNANLYNRQIAEWLLRVGGEKALFHDDATKNTAVRQFFKDVHAEVSPGFAKPTETDDGGV